MTDRPKDIYTQEAERIAASEDPKAELLKLAKFVMEDRRRRQRRALLSVVAALVLGAPLALWGLDGWRRGASDADPLLSSRDPRDPDEAAREPETQMAWLARMRDRPKAKGLTDAEGARVLEALMDRLPEARRRALRVAIEHTLTVQDDDLLWFLSNPEAADDSIALRLVWHNSVRNGTFAKPTALEPFAISGERACRKYALRALAAIPTYVPTPEVIKHLHDAPDGVRSAVQELLSRSGQ